MTALALASNNPSPQRPLPASIEAEQALLGAILTNNKAYDRVCGILRPDYFADAAHGAIYDYVERLIEGGVVATPVTLKSYLDGCGGLESVGGTAYLARLAGAAITLINVHDYAVLIREMWLRRRLIQEGASIVEAAYSHDLDVSAGDMLSQAEGALDGIGREADTGKGGLQPIGAESETAMKDAEAAVKGQGPAQWLATGIAALDEKFSLLRPGFLVVAGGATSMGKTALATTIADNAARSGKRVAFISLEMRRRDLFDLLAARAARVSHEDVVHGRLNSSQLSAFINAGMDIQKLPLLVDDTPEITPALLKSRLRPLKRKGGLDLVVVDYIQLMRADQGRGNRQRYEEVGEISRSLKRIAKELDVPIMALSQLSREIDRRENPRPRLSDLRESGSIEQDADAVVLIYRRDYYLSRDVPERRAGEKDETWTKRRGDWETELERERGRAHLIVPKLRKGRTGESICGYDGQRTYFHDLDDADGVQNISRSSTATDYQTQGELL